MTAPIRHPILQWLIYGHIWLACCVAAQVWWTGLFMAEAPELWRYTIAVSLGVVAAYGLMRWIRSREPQLRASAHINWFVERSTILRGIVIVCVIAACDLCWPPRWQVHRWLILGAGSAMLYVTPFTSRNGLPLGLRRVPGLKAFLIAIVWALVVVAVPMEYDLAGHSPTNIMLMMCMRLPLFLALAIAFDVRDLPYDPPALRTIPQLFGMRGAKAIALLMLLGSALFEHVFLRSLDYQVSAWLVLLPYALTSALIAFAGTARGPLYFDLVLDGMLILIPASVWVGMHW